MIISISLTYKAVNYKQLCLMLNVFLGHIYSSENTFLHGLLFYRTENKLSYIRQLYITLHMRLIYNTIITSKNQVF
jgi:hypothetical protein